MISHTPHIVVSRPVNEDDGTNLHEFWTIDAAFWHALDDGEEVHAPPVNCYVAPWSGTHDTTGAGVPPKSESAKDSCNWEEVPQEVRDKFREEANTIQRYFDLLSAEQ